MDNPVDASAAASPEQIAAAEILRKERNADAVRSPTCPR
jgi:hypothetical protein